jgi:hypothetical protein
VEILFLPHIYRHLSEHPPLWREPASQPFLRVAKVIIYTAVTGNCLLRAIPCEDLPLVLKRSGTAEDCIVNGDVTEWRLKPG